MLFVFFSVSLWDSQAPNVQWNMIRSSDGNQLYIGCTFFALNRIKIRLLPFKSHFDLSSCHNLRHILQFDVDGNEKQNSGPCQALDIRKFAKNMFCISCCAFTWDYPFYIQAFFLISLLRIDFNQLTCSKHGLSNKNTCSNGSRGFFNK